MQCPAQITPLSGNKFPNKGASNIPKNTKNYTPLFFCFTFICLSNAFCRNLVLSVTIVTDDNRRVTPVPFFVADFNLSI